MLIDMNETNETDNFSDGRDLPLINVNDDVPQKSVIAFNQDNSVDNNNSINSNYDYNMDNKNNSNNKNTEEDPLTGQREFVLNLQNAPDPNLRWRNKFASTNFFMVIFLLAYVLQGCYFTYFVSVITTIEKLFKIKSAVIALLLNFSEAGQIATSLFLTYFAGRGHRPRWIACGMFLFSIAAFGSVSPHFIFGDRLYHQNELSTKTIVESNPIGGMIAINKTNDLIGLNLCFKDNEFFNQTVMSSNCDGSNEQRFNNSVTLYVLIILAVSLLGIGIGQTAIATLGIPYIDDNVQSKQSPLYMAITIGVRILGPALGYYLGSVCMRISYDFSPDKIHTDPGFTGAWYLGLLLVSTSMFLASLVMFTFPKTLRSKTTKVQPIEEKTNADAKNEELAVVAESGPKFRDFGRTIKRQLKNDILMFRTASAVLHLLPITGLYVFLPKYLETQFHLSAADANWISGTFGILVMGVGIFVTGVISVKCSLSAKKVSLWIAFTALATALGLFTLSTLGCSLDNYAGLQKSSSGSITNSLEFVLPCNKSASCGCDTEKFSPICGADGKNYFSPCHAGCSDANKEHNSSTWSYHDCACISDDSAHKSAVNGFCNTESCNTILIVFITVFAITVFIHSTSEVGGMLIIMRCTHPKDKSMAMGIVQFSLGLLSNIPCPHIFGRIIDATCIVWNKVCDKNSFCSFYNADTFRKYFFGVSCFIMMLAFVMDMIVFFKSHRIDIDPEGNEPEADTPNREHQNEDPGEENLIRLNKLTHESDEDQQAKIGV